MTMLTGGMPPPIDDELLSAWLDGQVSPAEHGAVEAAIAADPAVRARAADLRATVALLRALPQPASRRTFILTPEQAATIRPVRVPWITRLFPAVAAVSAVAAVLCLALIAGDLATGGFSTKTSATSARPVTESVTDATVTNAALAPTTAAAPTTVAPAATTAPAPVAGAAVSRAPAAAAAIAPVTAAAGSAAPAPAAAAIAPTALSGTMTAVPALTPTVGSFAGSSGALPASPTIVANVSSPPPVVRAAPSAGATVTKESHRVPLALVRAGEIVLALLAIGGLILVALGGRAKMRRA
ncbi:MAG TPA: hypothetical protein VIG44_05490 [Thermomicrobiales bacterium]